MDIRQIRHFVSIVRLGSFSLAAQDLHLTQSALSRSIRALEDSLGVKLLERDPTGVRTTLYGDQLLSYGQRILALSEEAVTEIDGLRGARRGVLRVGCMGAVVRTIVPQTLVRFRYANPHVEVTVEEGLNNALLGSLHACTLDVVVTIRPPEVLGDDFEWRALREEQVEIVAGMAHPLASQKNITAAQLASYQWVAAPRPEPDRLSLDRYLALTGAGPAQIAFETTSVNFLRSILAGSMYLSYQTGSCLNGQTSEVTALSMQDPPWSRTICAVFRRHGIVRPTVLAFVRDLERMCHPLGAVKAP